MNYFIYAESAQWLLLKKYNKMIRNTAFCLCDSLHILVVFQHLLLIWTLSCSDCVTLRSFIRLKTHEGLQHSYYNTGRIFTYVHFKTCLQLLRRIKWAAHFTLNYVKLTLKKGWISCRQFKNLLIWCIMKKKHVIIFLNSEKMKILQ